MRRIFWWILFVFLLLLIWSYEDSPDDDDDDEFSGILPTDDSYDVMLSKHELHIQDAELLSFDKQGHENKIPAPFPVRRNLYNISLFGSEIRIPVQKTTPEAELNFDDVVTPSPDEVAAVYDSEYDYVARHKGFKKLPELAQSPGDIQVPFPSRDPERVSLDIPPDERWQSVRNAWTYIFSAHRDPRHAEKCQVYVFGVSLTSHIRDKSTKLFCHMINEGLGLVDTVLGLLRTVQIRDYKYESFVLLCRLDPSYYIYNSSFISISTGAWDKEHHNLLRVNDNLHSEAPVADFSACNAAVLHGETSPLRLIEWLELNEILGFQKIILYVVDMTQPAIKVILGYYRTLGLIQVMDLSSGDALPGIWRYADFAMMQECLFRTMYKTKYLALLDIDETIAPRQSHRFKLSEMLSASHCENRSYIAALNYYFDPSLPDDPLYVDDHTVNEKLRLTTLLKTKREPDFLRFEMRSRNIVRPENVDHIKPHKTWLRRGFTEFPCVMHPDVGALYHYDTGDPDPSQKVKVKKGMVQDKLSVRDRSMHKYKDILIQRTMLAHLQIGL